MEGKIIKFRLLTASVLMLMLLVPVTSQTGNCILKGRVYTNLEWYGYLLQKTFQRNISRIQYTISYPVTECCANLLIYYDDQMRDLHKNMTCKEREAILPVSNNQVIPLVAENGTVGCEKWTSSGDGQDMYVCKGERTFRSSAPRRWYIAISRCNATTPLTMNYMFNISGYYGNCEDDPLTNTYVPNLQVEDDKSSYNVAIAMGVIAGIATLVAIVFITLYVLSRRQINQKPKTSGSVTSSQATMTQDIFYVNPSLSDREHSDSQYSRSSSENYYEVIPDRRSYESINTQLALHGHAGRTLNLAGLSREHRARIPSYIFEDIPPPPYQPPNLQAGHQHQGSGSGHPLSQANGHGPYAAGLHPMASRLVPINSSQQGTIPASSRIPIHSSAAAVHAAMTSGGNTLLVPNHSSAGSHSSTVAGTSGSSLQNQNGGITTSAGGLNSQNTNTLPRSQNSEHPIPLQNGGAVQNGVLSHGTVGRYPLHNSNHGKLLNHAYRIQQFETTA